MSLWVKLFFSFLEVGVFSIGGGYAAIPIIQSRVVETNDWLTLNEFSDLITIAEMTPGPIAVNSATFVGNRVASVAGGVVATVGCIFPSCIICSLLAFIYYRYRKVDVIQSVMSFLRPVVVGLIVSTGFRLLMNVSLVEGQLMPVGVLLVLGSMLCLRVFKMSPIWVMVLSGLAYTLLI